MTRTALRAAAFVCGLGIALPCCWAQTTPVSQFAPTQTVDWPGHVNGGAVRLYDINGNVIGGATHPMMVECPDGTTNCFSGGGGGSVTQGTSPWVVSGAAGVSLPLESDTGSPGATACSTDTGSCTLNALLQRLAQRLTAINTTLGTPATAANQSTANTSLSSILSALGSPFQAGGSLTVQPGNTANTTPWLVTPKGVQDSGGTDITDTTLHALKAEQIVNTGNAATVPHICGSSVTVSPSTATDTLAVEISGSTDIYICDISASSNGTNNFFLESAASTSCASTKVQIGNTWYTQQFWGRIAANPYYRGMHTGAGKGLCVNTSAANALSVTIHYDQY